MKIKDVTKPYLAGMKPDYIKARYPVPKWIQFCDAMLDIGYKVRLIRAKTTYSKYIYVRNGRTQYKVRFSNHRPNQRQEEHNDADYYVGISNFQVMRTEAVIMDITQRLGPSVEKSSK